MQNHLSLSIMIFLTCFVSTSALQAKEVQHNMRVDGITCHFCVASSAEELKKIDGVVGVDSDLESGIIKVCANDSVQFTDETLTRLFESKGFTYKSKQTIDACEEA